jgi:hypothetical protein
MEKLSQGISELQPIKCKKEVRPLVGVFKTAQWVNRDAKLWDD